MTEVDSTNRYQTDSKTTAKRGFVNLSRKINITAGVGNHKKKKDIPRIVVNIFVDRR